MTTRSLSRVLEHVRRFAPPRETRDRTDGQLLDQFIDDRDERAFEALVRRHGAMVLGVCRRILASPHDAEDAFQATFVVLVRRATSVIPRDAVGNWLYGVAYRTALAARAARARRKAKEGQVSRMADPENVPDELARKELHLLLDQELATLPAKYRAPVVLCDLEGRTLREAARLLGWPDGTLSTRLMRSRRLLARRLARHGLTLGSGALAAILSQETAQATVPCPLVICTVQAATAVGAGQALAPAVALLAEGVVKTMFLNKLKILAVVALVMGLVGLEAGVLLRTDPPGGRASAATADPPAVRKEPAKENEVGLPRGWFGGSANTDAYEVGVDRKVFHGGKASAYIRMKDAADTDFGTIGQTIKAKAYRGRRVRLTAYLKTADAGTGAGLWMRVDCKDAMLTFDNMDARRVKGTRDWSKVAIVLDVPEKAEHITIGMLLHRNGKAWVDDFKLETVGKEVPSTNLLTDEVPGDYSEQSGSAKPINLDFEDNSAAPEKPAPAEPLTMEQKAWLRKHAVPFDTAEPGRGFADLQPLKKVVGDARIVALGEGTHGTREFFQMKHRLTEFLASELGFTFFAIEANLPEAYRVNEYVLTGKGDPKELLHGMYFWTWDTQEVLDLILWMRRFNESGKGKVQFLGFDMQTGTVALANVRRFVAHADPKYTKELDQAYEGLADYWSTSERRQAASLLPRPAKEAQAKRAWDVVRHLEAAHTSYSPKTDAGEVDRAVQDARVAAQAVQLQSSSGYNYRDECMADNVAWILDHAPKGSKIVLWAHNGHVARQPGWMGAHLAKRYSKEMVIFGFGGHEGRYTAVSKHGLTSDNELVASVPGSLEWHLHETGLPRLVLDLRQASKEAPASAWLWQPLAFRSIGALAMEQQFFPTVVPEAYDALIYFDRTTPSACFPVNEKPKR